MIRCFLSHSSNDKITYVKIVADRLGGATAVYDEYTFEEGMRPVDEIVKGLTSSQLFVIFLSESALNSHWVRTELTEAKGRYDVGQLKRIYPIIIDRNISHKDPRIPEWMRDEYNLKLISKPTVAVRRINQRLRELSWQVHPRLLQRQKIFVGRNDKIRELEERMDDFDMPPPICIIASGLKRIGRKSLLTHAFTKSNLMDPSYRPPLINLRRHESIEDLILKTYDLGFSDEKDLRGLLDMPIGDKVKLAARIITDVQQAREVLFVDDDGCLVNYSRQVEPWFLDTLQAIADSQVLTIAVASSFRPIRWRGQAMDTLYALNVPELNVHERNGLFKRLLEVEEIHMDRDYFSFFGNLFYGYPEQIAYAVDLIRDYGPRDAKKYAHQVQEFNSERASIVLKKYRENAPALELLYLLAEFEFISFDFLFDVVDEQAYSGFIDELIACSVCDYVGVEHEYLRLNDTVRDFVRRNRLGVPEGFRLPLQKHVDNFLARHDKQEADASDYLYSVKSALTSGQDIDPRYLIPSHFLITMRDLYYQKGNLDRVIELADLMLQKESALDGSMKNFVLYYLCLSLARKRDPRCLREAQRIQGPEHHFILGFYYRICARYRDAIERLQKAMEGLGTAVRAKRELVQVYLAVHQFDKALQLARRNYEENKQNHHYIQAYFNCLINSESLMKDRGLLIQLVEELEQIGSDQAQQMAAISRALLYAKYDNSYDDAIKCIDDAINTYADIHYPVLAKFEICLRFRNVSGMEDSIRRLEEMSVKRMIYKEMIDRCHAFYHACRGHRALAYAHLERVWTNYPEDAKGRLRDRIEHMLESASD